MSPLRWAVTTSRVSGRCRRSCGRTPLRQPPSTTGTQPGVPVRALAQRMAYKVLDGSGCVGVCEATHEVLVEADAFLGGLDGQAAVELLADA